MPASGPFIVLKSAHDDLEKDLPRLTISALLGMVMAGLFGLAAGRLTVPEDQLGPGRNELRFAAMPSGGVRPSTNGLEYLPSPRAAESRGMISPQEECTIDDFEGLHDHSRSRRLDVFHSVNLRSKDCVWQDSRASKGHPERLHLPKHYRRHGRPGLHSAAKEQ